MDLPPERLLENILGCTTFKWLVAKTILCLHELTLPDKLVEVEDRNQFDFPGNRHNKKQQRKNQSKF